MWGSTCAGRSIEDGCFQGRQLRCLYDHVERPALQHASCCTDHALLGLIGLKCRWQRVCQQQNYRSFYTDLGPASELLAEQLRPANALRTLAGAAHAPLNHNQPTSSLTSEADSNTMTHRCLLHHSTRPLLQHAERQGAPYVGLRAPCDPRQSMGRASLYTLNVTPEHGPGLTATAKQPQNPVLRHGGHVVSKHQQGLSTGRAWNGRTQQQHSRVASQLNT